MSVAAPNSCIDLRLPRQAGLTLLEILVTMVILSLGLLGLAALQMTGLKNNRNAYYNSVAAQIVLNVAEQLRGDASNAATGSTYDNLAMISADSAQCKPDVETFTTRMQCLAAALPSGQVWIHPVTGSNPKTFYVAVRWADVQLNGGKGWAANTASNPAKDACGEPVADTGCYYSMVRP